MQAAAASPVARHRILVGDTPVRYVVGGSGPDLLLVHGNLGSWENFRDWLPVLLPRFRVIIPDLPGCGDSPPLSGRHTAAAYADVLHEIATRLGLREFALGGLCLGASVALAYVERHRPALTALLLHTPPYSPAAMTPFFRWQVRVATSGPLFAAASAIARSETISMLYRRLLVEGDGVVDANTMTNWRNQQRASPRAARDILRDIIRLDFTPLLRRLEVPTFALVADNDAFVRVEAVRRLETLMPAARVAVLREAGHGWTAAFIAAQNAVLEEWARSVVGGV